MAKTYRDQVVILKRVEYGEADAIVTVFSRNHGLLATIAKGARRLNSRKSGSIELFNQIDVLLAEGRNLDVIQEASLIDAFDEWRTDLELISLAYYATDITGLLLAEGEPYTYIYDRLIEFYAWLGKTVSASLLVRWYEVQLLDSLGFWSSQTLDSQSLNAIALLDRFAKTAITDVAKLKVSAQLDQELERLMRWQMAVVLDRQPKSEKFVEQVREL